MCYVEVNGSSRVVPPEAVTRLVVAAQDVLVLIRANRVVLDADTSDLSDCVDAFDELEAATVAATQWAAALGGNHV